MGSTRLANLLDEAQLARSRHVATATVPRAARTIAFGRRIPIAPITIFSGRLPTLKRCGHSPRCGPHPHHDVKISQPEHGGNGVRSRVVNEWLICISVDLRAQRLDSLCMRPSSHPSLCRIQTICCTKSSLTTDLRFQPVNLFDCATVESFCGLQGRKGFVR